MQLRALNIIYSFACILRGRARYCCRRDPAWPATSSDGNLRLSLESDTRCSDARNMLCDAAASYVTSHTQDNRPFSPASSLSS